MTNGAGAHHDAGDIDGEASNLMEAVVENLRACT